MAQKRKAKRAIMLYPETKELLDLIRIELERKLDRGNVTFDQVVQRLIQIYRRETP